MKKLLCLALVLAMMLFAFCSCFDYTGGVDGDTSGDGTQDDQKPDNGDGDYVPSEEYLYGNATVFIPGDTVQLVADTAYANAFATFVQFYLDPVLSYGEYGGSVTGSSYLENKAREVVIGVCDESRPATVTAYRLLERMERDEYFSMRYLVYASSGTIVIAYDENELTNLQILDVIDEELRKFIVPDDADYISFPEGVITSGVIDMIAAQEEIDSEKIKYAWDRLEQRIGTAATDAMRKLYSLYGDDMPEWAANLYDPGTGGFYTCTSGRDGIEFGPDVECTVQILRFFQSSGMTEDLSSDWMELLPEKMIQQMIYFAKSLQHPNGYFYHPQWGKEATDQKISRRGRDLGWATTLLGYLGSAPQYKAANGKAGDGISADEYWQSLVDKGEALSPKPYPSTMSPTLDSVKENQSAAAAMTEPFGSNTVVAVSKVVAASEDPEEAEIDSSVAYLSTYTNFIDYLLVKVGPGLDSNPYSMGNTLNATNSQISTWSDTLEKQFADNGMNGKYVYSQGDELTSTSPATAILQFRCNTDSDKSNDLTLAEIYKSFEGLNLKEMTIKILDERINPDFGLWGVVSATNPTGTEFLFTNGYMKIMSTYNKYQACYPAEYIDDAANALVTGILGDQPSTKNVCEVYNVWTSIGLLKSNLKFLDSTVIATDENGNEILDSKGKPVTLKAYVTGRVDEILENNMAAAIENTYEKIKGYKKADGGFDHAYERTPGGYTSQQGMRTGIAQEEMSNIDATCIASTGLTREIYSALGISGLKVPLFTESDWMRVLDIFMNCTPVVKYSYDGEGGNVEYHDFEVSVPSTDYVKPTLNGNSFSQVTIDKDGVGLIDKNNVNGQAYLDFKVNSKSSKTNVTVFESDLMFKNINAAAAPIELRMYDGVSSSANRIYTLYIYVNEKDGGNVYIAPKSDTSKKIAIAKVGEWFNLKLVYCQGGDDQTKEPSAFKVYVNGSKTPTIVDPKFETGTTVASGKIGFVRFITMQAFNGKIYLDDARFAQEYAEYANDAPTHNAGSTGGQGGSGDTPAEKPGLQNTTAGCTIASKDGVITFDGVTSFPIKTDDGVVFSNKSAAAWGGYLTAEKEGDNSFIRINDLYKSTEQDPTNGDRGQCILLFDRPDNRATGSTFVFEGKFRQSPLANGDYFNPGYFYLDLTFRDAKGDRVYRTYFGGNTIRVNKKDVGIKDAMKEGEWYTLRVEYTVSGADADSATWDVKAYVNNELVQTCNVKTTESKYADSNGIDKVGILFSKDYVGCLDIDDVKMYNK